MQHSQDLTGLTPEPRPPRQTAQQQSAEIQRLSDEVARARERATRLLDFTTALSEARSVGEVTSVVLTKGVAIVEASRAVLVALRGEKVTLLGTRGISEELEASLRTLTLESEVPVIQALRKGEMIWIESSDEFRHRFGDPYQDFAELANMETYLSAPLIHSGETVGALALHFQEAGALGAADRTFTLLLAQAAATALYRARSYDAEQELRRRAELIADARAEVLGIVAHDLRNPLSLIVTTTELLMEEDLAPAQRQQVLDIARRAGKRMNRLIEDLLDTVQLESGRLSLVLEDVDVAAIFRQSEESFRPLAARRDISLVPVPPEEGLRVRADAFRLSQALGNLLGNAIKFTPEGGEVTFRADRVGREVVFSVSDTGPGIPPEQMEHLFEQFWQARKNDKRGVGLGLTIVKGIVEAHGGRIWCRSNPGAGSTFSFALPATDP